MSTCDPIKINEQLQQAQAAYHALLTGQQARVIVDQNGERVEFTAANSRSLYNYICQLQNMLAQGNCNFAVAARPMGFLF